VKWQSSDPTTLTLGPERCRSRLRLPGALFLTVLLCGAAGAVPVRDDAALEVVEILSDREMRAEQPGVVLRQLIDLGPEATDGIFDLLAGRANDLGRGASLDSGARALLYEALRAWPATEVTTRMASLANAGSPLGERMVALRLLGEVGDASSIVTVSEIVASFTSKEARPNQVRATVETALRKILIRDRRAYGAVSDMVDELEEYHLPPIVAALGEGGAAEGQPILERVLDRDRNLGLDLLVLDALGKMDRFDPEADLQRCASVVRGYLDAQDPLFRRQAAVSLGRLRDGASVPDLIEALDDDDRRVRLGALWALHDITDLRFIGEQQRWLAWQQEQAEWYDSRSAELALLVTEGDAGPAVAALREIGEHPLFASDLVGDVARALRHESPDVAAYACGTLALLKDPKAFPLLVEALADERAAVRTAAGRCLQLLTGETLPAEPELWADWAESGKSAKPRG